MNRINAAASSLIIAFLIVAFPQNLFAKNFIVTGHIYANPNEFEYILEQAKINSVDTIFILGDIENVILNKIKFYENLYNIKIHTVPGNHEIFDNKNTNDYVEKYGSYKKFIEHNQLNILLNTMDSNGNKFSHSGYSIQGKQLEFLQETLEAVSENIDTINIFMHHALFLDGLTNEKLENIANNQLNKINIDAMKEYAKKNNKHAFLSNNLVKNTWYKEVSPILKKKIAEGKKINVFSGDNSISAMFDHDSIAYHLTGLRQHYKKPFHENDMQTYLLCDNNGCRIIFFKNYQPELGNYNNFLYKLDLLHKKPIVTTKNIDLVKSNKVYLDKNITNGYIFLEKEKKCSFPSYINLEYTIDGQSKKKLFTGMSTSRNRIIYLIGKKNKQSNFSTISIHADSDKNSCVNLKMNVYDYDISQELIDYKKEFRSFHIFLKDKNYEKIHSNIPTVQERQDREKRFKFKSVKGKISINNKPYKIKVKLKGGTWFHWMYDKKSYYIKFEDNVKPEKIFYIPEKRSIFGEHLIHQISKHIGLESLETTFGELYINNKNKGLYYVSDNFDKYFLLKNNLPEANIYHTDSFGVRLAGSSIEKINKNMFIGGIKKYKARFNQDIDYFLDVINKDVTYLEKNWEKHFDKENLIKLLSIYLLSGTVHYDLHNLYFYINPTNGKIYFFPWDFMNFSNAENLGQKFNLPGNVDYKNVNQILTKLLKIGQIRYFRNKFIYENGDNLISYIQKFKNDDLPYIISAMLTDSTVPLSFAQGQISLLGFMHIPKTIIDNIGYQIQKIKNNFTKLNFNAHKIYNNIVRLELDLLTYSGINIDYIKINYENNISTSAIKKNLQFFSDIQYKDELGSIIKIKPTTHNIDIQVDENKTIKNIEIQYSNIFDKKDIKIISSNIEVKETIKTNGRTFEKLYDTILDQKGKYLYFKSKNVTLKKDLILPRGTILNILPGTTLLLGKGVSIITYGSIIAKGTKGQKISFLPLNNIEPWGVIAMVGKDSTNVFEYCNFTGGSGAYNRGKYFSAMLSGYHIKDIEVSNCLFQGSKKLNGGDDAINIKNGSALIKSSVFQENDGDAIDFDFVDNHSSIIDSKFINNKNDAIDVSSSDVIIDNCIIESSNDKGVSAGERSNINIINSKIYKNKIGVASKDESFVTINGSKVENNIVGVGLYNKKEFYHEPGAKIINSMIVDNYINCGTEVFNKYGHNAPKITTNSILENTNKRYKYILKANLSGVSKRDTIRAFYDDGNFNKYIDFVTLQDCKIAPSLIR
jgi:hypothetical protein